MDIQTKARLAEIPKLLDLETREMEKLSRQIDKLADQRAGRLKAFRELQDEELQILRAVKNDRP